MTMTQVVAQHENRISDAELEIIKQLGLPNKIISQNIGIAETYIAVKVTRIAAKLGVENRTAIVIKALKLGLITIDQLVFREFNGETNSS